MPDSHIQAILLDIEGTTTPISFVHDVLFPYSKSNLHSYLQHHANSADLLADLTLLEDEHTNDVRNGNQPAPIVEPYVHWLIDQDRKSPALKSLQGKIWKQGYLDGSLKATLFPDVLPAMTRWRQQNIQIAIFSSGSVLAQKLLFQHTDAGDVTHLIQDFFDTGVGKKTETTSYQQISNGVGVATEKMLFISDVTAELAAAASASVNTLLCIRPGNPTQSGRHNFRSISTFSEI